MLKIWHTLKGYIAGVVAFIFCPCHLPITLPLLIALTAGTAFSAWLAQNTILVGAISTVLFVGGLALAFKWTGEAGPPLPDLYAGVPKVTLVTSPACGAACEDGKAVWRAAQAQANFKLEEVDLVSPRGRDLAARHNIFTTPAAVVNDSLVLRGVPSLEHALKVIQPITAVQDTDQN
jgi:hypothetical protein